MTNTTGPDNPLDANEIARISAALVAAIAEAHMLAADGQIGAKFREILQHAREMHALLGEHLDGQTEYARGLAESIGSHLHDLEAAVKSDLT